MKIISFLGTAAYTETTYSFEGQAHKTRFFPAALAHFIRPEMQLICVTPTVDAHSNLVDLGNELDRLGVNWQKLPIPEGRSETDLWRIFEAITSHVDNREKVIFDITYSFRSLPFLTFLAVAYLKAAKNVQVERVVYGAFDARDAAGLSPVFDLTPFVQLLDWLTATSRFIDTGDGQALAGLLRRGIPLGELRGSDPAARELGSRLEKASKAIESVSLALRMARPLEAFQSANDLKAALTQAMPGIRRTAPPFALLADQLVAEYGQFALPDPEAEANAKEGLRLQLELIAWYLKRRHIVQAATLAREWLVSLLAFQFNVPMLDYAKGRKLIEQALNNAVGQAQSPPRKGTAGPFDTPLLAHPLLSDLMSLWSRMAELRNDIAHSGMRLNAKNARKLKGDVEALLPDLDRIAEFVLKA